MSRHSTSRLLLSAVAIILAAGLTYAGPGLIQAQAQTLAELPPRPTAEPTPTPVPAPAVAHAPASSFIKLTTAFPASWPWHARHWRTVKTQVQWQTAAGDWVDVTGWYGAHDQITAAADDSAVATKLWWVAPEHYGTGPFRWVVLDEAEPLAVSAPFTLPVRAGYAVGVAVQLAAP
jgi:hypothetical protein